jgi:hypothetical protein
MPDTNLLYPCHCRFSYDFFHFSLILQLIFLILKRHFHYNFWFVTYIVYEWCDIDFTKPSCPIGSSISVTFALLEMLFKGSELNFEIFCDLPLKKFSLSLIIFAILLYNYWLFCAVPLLCPKTSAVDWVTLFHFFILF